MYDLFYFIGICLGWVIINVQNINVEMQSGKLGRHIWAGGNNLKSEVAINVDNWTLLGLIVCYAL